MLPWDQAETLVGIFSYSILLRHGLITAMARGSLWDAVIGKCSTEQQSASRREEKSFQGLTSALPPYNCVL